MKRCATIFLGIALVVMTHVNLVAQSVDMENEENEDRQLTQEQLLTMQKGIAQVLGVVLIDFGVENYDFLEQLKSNYFKNFEENNKRLKKIWDEFLTKNLDILTRTAIFIIEDAIDGKLSNAEKEEYAYNFKMVTMTMYDQIRLGVEMNAEIYQRVHHISAGRPRPGKTQSKLRRLI